MKHTILLILIVAIGLIYSCSKKDPEPDLLAYKQKILLSYPQKWKQVESYGTSMTDTSYYLSFKGDSAYGKLFMGTYVDYGYNCKVPGNTDSTGHTDSIPRKCAKTVQYIILLQGNHFEFNTNTTLIIETSDFIIRDNIASLNKTGDTLIYGQLKFIKHPL